MRTWLVGLVLTVVQNTATVTTNGPIYVTNTPGAGLAPLRVAAVGTVLKIVDEQGDWLQVQFQDPQWGRRTGWVQKKYVSLSNPNLKPMDLSIRETTGIPAVQQDGVDAAGRGETAQDPAAIEPRQPGSVPTDALKGHPQSRNGFWFNAGLGFGSLVSRTVLSAKTDSAAACHWAAGSAISGYLASGQQAGRRRQTARCSP